MTDNTCMTRGIHKGMRMSAVPATYLLHLPKELLSTRMKEYIADNLKILKLEARRDGRLLYKKWLSKR